MSVRRAGSSATRVSSAAKCAQSRPVVPLRQEMAVDAVRRVNDSAGIPYTAVSEAMDLPAPAPLTPIPDTSEHDYADVVIAS